MLLAPPTTADAQSIVLFPAWPCAEWDVQFKLHAPGQTVIEGELKDGKLASLSVTPASRRADVVMVACGGVPLV